jgi:hypothetical protein
VSCLLRLKRVRIVATAAAACLICLVLPLRATASSSPAASVAVELTGQGTWDVDPAQLVGWQNDLYGSVSDPKISLNYIPSGGPTGLTALLGGSADYAISGIPFTSAQLAGYPGGAKGIIAAPVMASAVGTMLDPPAFYVDNGQTGAQTNYTGNVKVPADNLAAQLFTYTESSDPISPSNPEYPVGCPFASAFGMEYGEWDNPAIISNWDSSFLAQYNPSTNGDIFFPCGGADNPTTYSIPQVYYQAEANEDTYYAQEWAAQASPTIWGMLKKIAPAPLTPGAQLATVLQKNVSLAAGLPESINNFLTGSGGLTGGGRELPAPPSGLLQAQNLTQKTGGQTSLTEWIYVQNDNGDWVAPSPASIDAAIDATPAIAPTATTGAAPLYAASNSVPGAYPLTYVDYLYAPAHGLSVEKTEALATAIRYLVTDGQTSAAAYNDGQLSSTFVLQALDAANQLVLSNCPPADVLDTSTLGPDTPTDLPGLDGLGTVEHCEIPPQSPSTTTTTTTAPTTATTVASTGAPTGSSTGSGSSTPPAGSSTAVVSPSSAGLPSGASFSDGASPGIVSPHNVVPRVPGSGTAKPSEPVQRVSLSRAGHKAAEAEPASNLPFGLVSGTQAGLDKLVALVAGVWLFLLVRRWRAGWLRRTLSR